MKLYTVFYPLIVHYLREYSGSLRICHFKEFLLNTTEKFSLLAQAFTKIYTLHLQGKEFRKRQKIHAVNSYTGYHN